MKTTLLSAGMLLALSGCGGSDSSAPGAAAGAPAATVAALPEVSAATAFADSLSALPGGAPADATAARAYTQAVGAWYGSELSSGIKAHPLADGIWKNYRAVLRMVAKSRGMKKVKPEDAKQWDGFAGECETVAKTIIPLTQDNPAPTSDKALPQLQMAWDGMQHVRLGAERHMMYLEHPYTRDQR
ncbi:hypothetical protein FNT36_24965 [Hymenobacter setariae]|uniref:Uncharacterized protein n=1 Tax=Hymenobacter setariae TaxID=2594794 RepID=A0A558BJT5_9BACT|nr:hypothetical protein [Hymenobacter setariae]TVT36768.1 hypothetical protein FNT36_24965 [Hymenobacter setariae]